MTIRKFNFDNIKEGGGYKPPSEGEHTFMITEVKSDVSKSGNEMDVFDIVSVDDEGQARVYQ